MTTDDRLAEIERSCRLAIDGGDLEACLAPAELLEIVSELRDDRAAARLARSTSGPMTRRKLCGVVLRLFGRCP